MRILFRLFTAALFIVGAGAQDGSAQVSHVVFDTTGDFGVADNWSDPAKAPPTKPPGVGIEHLSYFYYINGDRTATISAGSPNGSHFEVAQFFPGDSPPDQFPTPGNLVLEGGIAPAPDEFGASLTVVNTNRFIIGQRCNQSTSGGDPFGACGGGGTVTMNGASDLLAAGIVIGERDFGSLLIGPDARVRSGSLDEEGALLRQDMRIGSFGPSRGLAEPIPQLLEGEGFVEVHGELVANTIFMPESGATGTLRVMPGATVNIRGIDMTFEPQRTSRSATLEVLGSGGSFTLTAGLFDSSHPSVTVKFTADAGGVTAITGGSGADVDGGNLILDLDDFNFTPTSELTLIDVPDFSLFGTFGNVTFAGNTTATVNYDEDGGRLFLNQFMSTDPPDLFGDYNDDGVVNVADYTVWRDNLGSNNTLPNDQTPGTVMQVDYDVWKTNFGQSNSGAVTDTAVPEPGALAIAAVVLAIGWTGTRGRSGGESSVCD
jgi:hypothetical protein